ncbi:MAG: hypothetical protein ACE366_04275 [Bradymonadia bacterium]
MGWYLREGYTQAQGPFTEDEVIMALEAGEGSEGVFASRDGKDQWIAVSDHPPFARAIARSRSGQSGPPATAQSTGPSTGSQIFSMMLFPPSCLWIAFDKKRPPVVRGLAWMWILSVIGLVVAWQQGILKFR